jgi:hypothetical protein
MSRGAERLTPALLRGAGVSAGMTPWSAPAERLGLGGLARLGVSQGGADSDGVVRETGGGRTFS